MSRSREPEQAALYRFDTGGLARIRTITVGNGTDWDVERGRMYHVDSVTQRIDVFDYDIALPTPFVTCPAFGGDDLSVLFVTSSQHKIPPGERAGHPLAGALFTIDAGVTGRPADVVAPAVADEVIG